MSDEFQIPFHEFKPAKHSKDLILIADGLELIDNVAGLFRLADAMGVKRISFTSPSDTFSPSRLKKISRSCSSWIPVDWDISLEDVLQNLSDDYLILALEYTNQSIPVQQLQLRDQTKIALILGSEVRGISKYSLDAADQSIHVPMYGRNSSMNVIQAASIALFTVLNK